MYVARMNEILSGNRVGEQVFVVCMHDVNPSAGREIMEQVDALYPLTGAKISAAIIPAAQSTGWSRVSGSFLRTIDQFEKLLHGFNHRRPCSLSPFSYLSGRCDEFAALRAPEAERRLQAGQKIIADTFGAPAQGFLPPAWQAGSVTNESLIKGNITFQVGFSELRMVSGRIIPLGTYSWDWGPVNLPNCFGSLLGSSLACRGGAVRVIGLHPCDRERGHFNRALDLIRYLIDKGLRPVSFRELGEAGA